MDIKKTMMSNKGNMLKYLFVFSFNLIISILIVLSIAFIQHFFNIRYNETSIFDEQGFPFYFHYESHDNIQGINMSNFIIDVMFFYLLTIVFWLIYRFRTSKRG